MGTTPAPTVAESVSALARQVERLERRLQGYDIESLRSDVRGVTVTVAAMAEEVAELVNADAKNDEAASSWLWPVEPMVEDEVASVLRSLVRWTARVYLQYGDGALPECWLWHPDVIEELVWLHGAWQAAYHGPMASAQRAADWHDRQRPGVARRVRNSAGNCSLREHLDPVAGPVVPAADAAPAIAAWWADPSATVPVPTGAQIRAADAAHGPANGRPQPRPDGGWR
jgi:hypothetical protein